MIPRRTRWVRINIPVPGFPKNTILNLSFSNDVPCLSHVSILPLIESNCNLTASSPTIPIIFSICGFTAPSRRFCLSHSPSAGLKGRLLNAAALDGGLEELDLEPLGGTAGGEEGLPIGETGDATFAAKFVAKFVNLPNTDPSFVVVVVGEADDDGELRSRFSGSSWGADADPTGK